MEQVRTEYDWLFADAPPNGKGETGEDWPNPEEIGGELPPVPSFVESLLPDPMRPQACDVSERMQVPLDFTGVAGALCTAGSIGRRATIQPKEKDTGYIVVPNLWGGIVALSGLLKTPTIQNMALPLTRIQSEGHQEHEEATKEYKRQLSEYELRSAVWKEKYKSAMRKGVRPMAGQEDEPQPPTLRRLIVNDATSPTLHVNMAQNPAGMLLIADEMSGWLSQMETQGREGERAFWLSCWPGDVSYTVDRIARGTIHVPACCMSILAGIQPDRLRSYLTAAVRGGPDNDGMMQRFQLLVWPNIPKNWQYVDRPPDPKAAALVARIYSKLLELDPTDPLRFHFAPDASELYVSWLTALEAKIRSGGLHPAMVSHLSKYRSLMPSLALQFELVSQASAGKDSGNAVLLDSAERAVRWCEYLEAHANRIYSCVVSPQLRATRELAQKIKERRIGAKGFLTSREVYRHEWSGLDTPELARQAAEQLEDAGWLRSIPVLTTSSGGRPSDKYQVNPKVWAS